MRLAPSALMDTKLSIVPLSEAIASESLNRGADQRGVLCRGS